jgi:integrase
MRAAKRVVNFTKPTLDAMKAAPAGKRRYINDAKLKGLQLVITDRGVKTFYLYKRNAGKPLRFFLGHYPDLTPANARKKAEVARGRAAMNEDLRAEKKRAKARGATLSDAFKAFKTARVNLKPKTIYGYGRFLDVDFEDWKDNPIIEITKDKVAALHRKLGENNGHSHADHAMRFLRSLLNFAQFHYEDSEGRPLLPDNPVRRLSQTRSWYRTKRRTTYVRPDEIKPWFEAVLALKSNPDDYESVAVSDWLQLTILTGLRRGEGLSLKWSDVDLGNKTLTLHDTKNGEDHTLPLSDYVHGILEQRSKASVGEFVFRSYGREGFMVDSRKALEAVIAESGVHFTPHDLRRTFITIAESLDIPAYALKRLLNHKMRQDVTAGYIVTDVERLRRPMQQVSDFILKSAALKATATLTDISQGRS